MDNKVDLNMLACNLTSKDLINAVKELEKRSQALENPETSENQEEIKA